MDPLSSELEVMPLTDERTTGDGHDDDGAAVLAVEVRRLRAALWAVRIRYANLVAAGRATLVAAADGEADPLAYLRDELPPAPPGHPLHAERGWS